ncbi:MAG: cob(I)yrinic acid a,c-diamide adenosyltransferase [Longimicrobiales bacterium]
MPRIYTKTGDTGETGLFGGGRVSKANIRVEAYGAVDELNSFIGWVLAQGEEPGRNAWLQSIQADLFTLGAQLASPEPARGRKPTVPDLPNSRVAELEQWIDQLEAGLPDLRNFILPGGSHVGAALHVARTVCRRAERRVVALSQTEAVNAATVIYLNRLSDLLFVMARAANRRAGAPELAWHPPA